MTFCDCPMHSGRIKHLIDSGFSSSDNVPTQSFPLKGKFWYEIFYFRVQIVDFWSKLSIFDLKWMISE